MRKLTARQMQRRRSEVIKALSDLSRNGWQGVQSCDYQPLERELDDLNRELAQDNY